MDKPTKTLVVSAVIIGAATAALFLLVMASWVMAALG